MKLMLTTQFLNNEYESWGDTNRRNDLRFGQYIHATYDLVPDVAFHIENKYEAYHELLNALTDYQR